MIRQVFNFVVASWILLLTFDPAAQSRPGDDGFKGKVVIAGTGPQLELR